eukprot:g11394.t1
MSVAKGVSESLRNPVGRGMLGFFTESVWQIGFARSLGVYDGMVVTSLGQQGSMLEAEYTIPDNICITGGTVGGGGGAFLPCGVTTALFDEVSTLAMVIADRKYRPGVSISLSCQMFHPVAPGERVTFKSRGLKMGARLGKLQMRQHEQWLRDPERTKGIPSGEHLLDMFKLENVVRYGGEGDDTYFGAASSGGSDDDGGFRSAEAEVLVTRRMCNYLPGTMHGGAIAVAAEEIARRCPPAPLPMDAIPVPGNPRIQYMEVHYMSPIKRRAGLAAVSAAAGTGGNVTRVGLSEAGGTDGGVLCAEAVLLWGQRGEEGKKLAD